MTLYERERAEWAFRFCTCLADTEESKYNTYPGYNAQLLREFESSRDNDQRIPYGIMKQPWMIARKFRGVYDNYQVYCSVPFETSLEWFARQDGFTEDQVAYVQSRYALFLLGEVNCD